MARTLIGVMASASPATPIVNRSASGGAINSEESLIAAASGIPGWHYGANRGHYRFLDEPWTTTTNDTKNAISGTSTADFENNRLPVITMKPPGNSASDWINVTNGTYDAMLTTRANEIITYQNAHRGQGKWGASFVWSFHHEPNGQDEWDVFGGSVSATGAAYIAATRHIYELWEAAGVAIWTGLSDWTTYTEGLILAINLVDGHASASNNSLSKNFYWGPANGGPGPGDTWMDAHCVMFTTDPYPVVSFLPFSDAVSVAPGGGSTNTIRSWANAKRTYQTSQGRPFMEGILETGIKIRSQYTVVNQAWTDTGRPSTSEEWIDEMHDYIRDSWPNLNLLCYWDDRTTNFYELDNTSAQWAAAITAFTDTTTFASALIPLPSATPSTMKVLILGSDD